MATNKYDVKIYRSGQRSQRKNDKRKAKAAKRQVSIARRNSPEALARRARLRKGFKNVIKPFKEDLINLGKQGLGMVSGAMAAKSLGR